MQVYNQGWISVAVNLYSIFFNLYYSNCVKFVVQVFHMTWNFQLWNDLHRSRITDRSIQFQVMIRGAFKNGRCTGVIIHAQWVVTTANCLVSRWKRRETFVFKDVSRYAQVLLSIWPFGVVANGSARDLIVLSASD